MKKDSNHILYIIMALIILVALITRLWGISFQLPDGVLHPDEIRQVNISLGIAHGDINPHFFNYPTLFFYLIASLYKIIFWIINQELPSVDSLKYYVLLVLTGRLLSVSSGLLTIVTTYFLGKRIGDARIGLIASFLLSLNYLHVRVSHFITVDATMTLLATLSLLMSLKAFEDEKTRSFILAALLGGLATAVKYTAGFLGVSVLAAHFFLAQKEKNIRQFFFHRRIWLAVIVMVGIFIAASPYVVLDYSSFMKDFGFEMSTFRNGYYRAERPYSTFYYYFFVIMPHGFGFIPYIFSLCGISLWIKKINKRGLILLAFVLVFAFGISAGETVFARYLLPIIPTLCVAAAFSLNFLLNNIENQKWRRVAIMVLLAVCVPQSLWNIINFDSFIQKKDTRSLAQEWVLRNLQPGKILQLGGVRQHQILAPPNFEVVKVDFEQQPQLMQGDLNTLTQKGIKYILIHQYPLAYSRILPELAEKISKEAHLLKCFDPFSRNKDQKPLFDYEDAFYVPFAKFGSVSRPGPKICIYELGK